MGAKRKLSGGQPQTKKAKVEDPVQIEIQKLSAAIVDFGELLPAPVVNMLTSIIPDALSSTVEERTPLETEFAKLVGDSVKEAQKSLDAKAAAAAAAQAEKEAQFGALTAALDQANAVKTGSDKAVENAATAEREAKDAKTTAIDALEKQEEDEAKLPAQKTKLDTELADAQFALGVANGDVPAPKDAKKLAAQLSKIGAPVSLIAGMAHAVGKTDALEKMMVTEACKLLQAKITTVQGGQAAWVKNTADMATKTKTMEGQVTALTTAHDERHKELTESKAKQKTAVADMKEAEANKKSGGKALEKAKTASESAATEAEDCRGVAASYEWLITRSSGSAAPMGAAA